MELQMKGEGQACQVLPAGDNQIDTGVMGDCMSVIVYADRQADGTYGVVRGYHGLGGIEVVNWDSLFDRIVPEWVVVAGPGPSLVTEYRKTVAMEIVDEQLTRRFPGRSIPPVFYFGISQAVFDRKANKIR